MHQGLVRLLQEDAELREIRFWPEAAEKALADAAEHMPDAGVPAVPDAVLRPLVTPDQADDAAWALVAALRRPARGDDELRALVWGLLNAAMTFRAPIGENMLWRAILRLTMEEMEEFSALARRVLSEDRGAAPASRMAMLYDGVRRPLQQKPREHEAHPRREAPGEPSRLGARLPPPRLRGEHAFEVILWIAISHAWRANPTLVPAASDGDGALSLTQFLFDPEGPERYAAALEAAVQADAARHVRAAATWAEAGAAPAEQRENTSPGR